MADSPHQNIFTNIGIVCGNAVLHYFLYRLVVSSILVIKEILTYLWTLISDFFGGKLISVKVNNARSRLSRTSSLEDYRRMADALPNGVINYD